MSYRHLFNEAASSQRVQLLVNELTAVAAKLQALCRHLPGRDENYKKYRQDGRCLGRDMNLTPPHKYKSKALPLEPISSLLKGEDLHIRAVSSYDSGLNGSKHCPLRSALNFFRTSDGVDA